MTKLTPKEREILAAIPDWSAPYEVRERQAYQSVMPTLGRLVEAGLAEYGPANHTYRATTAGGLALQQESGKP